MCNTLPSYLYFLSVCADILKKQSILGFVVVGGRGWGGNHAVTKLGWRRVHGRLKRTRNSSTSFLPMANAAGELFLSLQVSFHLPFPHYTERSSQNFEYWWFLKMDFVFTLQKCKESKLWSMSIPPPFFFLGDGFSFFFSSCCLWSFWTLTKQAGFEFVLLSTFSFWVGLNIIQVDWTRKVTTQMILNCNNDWVQIYMNTPGAIFTFTDYGNGGYDCRIAKVWEKLQTKMDKLS